MRLLAATAFALAILAGPASAQMHTVEMLNRNDTGGMVFEPDYLAVEPGDTVKFLATHIGHNAATIDGFLPGGAEPFKGRINEEIEVTFTEPGFYGIECTPHFAMGMVMLIQVGGEDPAEAEIPQDMPARAVSRFAEIVERTRGPR